MDLRHDCSTFADRTAHSLYRAGPHVADGEYAVNSRLERSRYVLRGEGRRLTGQYETVFVEPNATAF